jgi:hypothetical protein
MIEWFLLVGLALIIVLVCCFVFWRRKTHGFGAYFLLGWTLQILFSLPAGIWQGINAWPHISISGLWGRFATPLFGWPFNTGGYTIRCLFEATVEPLEWLVGHRSATVLSNMPYYSFLLFVQGSILAGLFAWRYKKRRKCKDWFIICLGVLFLINSFLNVTWFWAGT